MSNPIQKTSSNPVSSMALFLLLDMVGMLTLASGIIFLVSGAPLSTLISPALPAWPSTETEAYACIGIGFVLITFCAQKLLAVTKLIAKQKAAN